MKEEVRDSGSERGGTAWTRMPQTSWVSPPGMSQSQGRELGVGSTWHALKCSWQPPSPECVCREVEVPKAHTQALDHGNTQTPPNP
jgi:hypothetical protein